MYTHHGPRYSYAICAPRGARARTGVHIHGRSLCTNCRIHRKTRAFRGATQLPKRLGEGSVRNFR